MKASNAQKYRKPTPKRTVSTFTDDIDLVENYSLVQPKKLEQQIRRDKDNVKQPSVTLYDVDYAVKYYIQKVIRPTIIENGEQVEVPLFYAGGEKWASMQKHGYIRDKKGKALAPAMSFKRTSVAPNTDMPKIGIHFDEASKKLFCTRYSKTNYYDNFAILENQIPKKELFHIEVPDYVTVSYDVQVWTRFNEHTNKIVEKIIYYEGDAFGDPNSYKFITVGDSYSFDTTNAQGEDRLSTATLTLTTKAYLLPDSVEYKSTIDRNLTVGKVVFNEGIIK